MCRPRAPHPGFPHRVGDWITAIVTAGDTATSGIAVSASRPVITSSAAPVPRIAAGTR